MYIYFIFSLLSVSLAAPRLNSSDSPIIGIVGGDEADIKDFPYQGALIDDRRQFCGAVLIRDDTALTAAHCVDGYRDISVLSIRFGSSQWRSGGQQIFVKDVIIHENYPIFAPDYDIAVLKLKERVNVPNAIPVPLAPDYRQYPDGTMAVVSGWGATSSGGATFPETLRKVDVPVVAEDRCRQTYGRIISARTICAGYREGGKDSCQQDSGGPLVVNGELAGIVSFGNGCALPNNPGVYASVPAFREWIRLHSGV